MSVLRKLISVAVGFPGGYRCLGEILFEQRPWKDGGAPGWAAALSLSPPCSVLTTALLMEQGSVACSHFSDKGPWLDAATH